MAYVELIYDQDCPNVSRTRAHLLRAFGEAHLPATWLEWERSDPTSPGYVRSYGSPTILVDGKDVAGAEASEGISCCRLYAIASGGFDGVPPIKTIVSSLLTSEGCCVSGERSGGRSRWRSFLATVPAVGTTFLPVGACPACWPVYAGFLSSLGLGFMAKTAYLLPLTLVFLSMAVGALAFRAGTRRGYGPFALGVVASAVVVGGKFVLGSNPIMYLGIGLLVAGSIWNIWPRGRRLRSECPACVSEAPPSRENKIDNSDRKEVTI